MFFFWRIFGEYYVNAVLKQQLSVSRFLKTEQEETTRITERERRVSKGWGGRNEGEEMRKRDEKERRESFVEEGLRRKRGWAGKEGVRRNRWKTGVNGNGEEEGQRGRTQGNITRMEQ
jgi:hypothetical protein